MDEPFFGHTNEFNDKQTRIGFIRKVYSILTIQLFVTFGSIFYVNDGYNIIMHNNISNTTNAAIFMLSDDGSSLLFFSLFFMFFLMISLMCCPSISRKSPINYIILSLLTLCISYLVSYITIFYTIESVFLAFGMTFFITFTLSIYACQTKYDYTDKGGYLLSVLIGIIIFSFLNIFLNSNILQSFISAISAILFSCYIVYDTQLIVGGNHKYQIEKDEYVFAAITLYLDIINLFISLLQLFGKKNDE